MLPSSVRQRQRLRRAPRSRRRRGAPRPVRRRRHSYLPRTNILETTFRTADAWSCSPTSCRSTRTDGHPASTEEIHRQIRCTRGRVPMQIIFMPRFEYRARATRLDLLRAGLFSRPHRPGHDAVERDFPWVIEQSTAIAQFDVEKGEARWLVLATSDNNIRPVDRYESNRKLDHRRLLGAMGSGVRYSGPFRGMVRALRTRARTPYPRRDRGDHRRGHDVAAETIGELGLPASSGCGMRPSRWRRSMPSAIMRSRRLHALPEARVRRKGGGPDHVRHRRPPRPRRTPARITFFRVSGVPALRVSNGAVGQFHSTSTGRCSRQPHPGGEIMR